MAESLQQVTSVLDIVFVPILVIELIWLKRRGDLGWARLKEMTANVSSLLFVIPAAIVGVAGWIYLFNRVEQRIPWSLPTTWFTAVLAVVLADLIYYLEHRFEHDHRLPWDLWHSVHHSSETYDQTTGLRLGLFDGLLTTGFSLPLILIGFPTEFALLASGVVIAYQTWIHTEVINKTPAWFEAVFNTASHHRAHHGSDEHYLDVNYGGILIIWDRMFGTFQPETTSPNYGLTTQIESSNPLDIQFSQLRILVQDLRSDTTWSTRWARLWNRPGWEPTAVPSNIR